MNCDKMISDNQILEAYTISEIIPKFRVSSYESNPKCVDENHKSSLIYLTKNNSDVLQHCCIHNEYFLIENEKTVKLHNITIKNTLRRDRLAKKIIYKNKEIYKQNGFKSIVLKAINDGVVVWKKLGFEFDNITDEKIVIKQFNIYLREIKGINEKFVNIKQVPKDYFFDESINFTDWLSSKNDANLQNFSMTLRITND